MDDSTDSDFRVFEKALKMDSSNSSGTLCSY